ncbi:hypothetical protein PSTG_19220 [Puccinia striiformis f. sp. tritici PST-78]|uniref:Uncharacterized protein n=1 Tax=Puccinia striiformis f. sp. tritici PST-78 TaxID=1165861 RepID=A0A0L0UKB9_9BASI|nr:hypothetical protein PSTG_19220 [Puccinia striiformis f. sp. tritici PST-78]
MHSAEHTRTIGTPSSTSRSNTPSTFHQLSSYQQLKRTTSKLFRSLTPTPPAVSPTAQHTASPSTCCTMSRHHQLTPADGDYSTDSETETMLPPSFLLPLLPTPNHCHPNY